MKNFYDNLPRVEPASDAHVREMNTSTSLLHIVVRLNTEGGGEFLRSLEYAHYTPGTPRNDLLQFAIVHWSGLPWYVCSIPWREREFAYEAAANTGTRLADGYPMAMSEGDGVTAIINTRYDKINLKDLITSRFPLDSDRTYTLEKRHAKAPAGAGWPLHATVALKTDKATFFAGVDKATEATRDEVKRNRAERN